MFADKPPKAVGFGESTGFCITQNGQIIGC
jgi:hypothetical protein